MKTGARPAPRALKVLRGEKDKSRINDAEPEFGRGLPDCPPFLKVDSIAMREWNAKVVALNDAGVLTEVDGAVLADYCEAFAQIARAVRARRLTKIGTLEYGRIATEVHRLKLQQNRASCELGLTPSARTRIKATPKKKDDKWSDFG